MADPQLLIERAKHLTALRESPSYPALRAIMEEKIAKETKRFLAALDVSNEQLHYGRGLLQGIRVAIDVIEGGPKELERAIAVARRIEGEED